MIVNVLKLKTIIMLCAIIFMSIAFAGTANANFWSNLMPKYTVSGKIVNQNQEPLEGVTINFSADGIGGEYRVVTDALGNYVLNLPAKTSGKLMVSKEKYRIVRQTFNAYYVAGEKLIYNYTLHPDFITGKITNVGGEPLDNVKIMIEQDGGLTGVQTVYTNENGNYTSTLPVDDRLYWITIVKEGYQTLRNHSYLSGGYTYNYILK